MNRYSFRQTACAFAILLAFSAVSFSDTASEKQAILDTFELHPEFQLELVAMEPVVLDPVDMEFDEHGRAFVMEMPGYPFADDRGSVVLIEDSDDDGVYDKRTVFATEFPVADSILPWRGGILVASPPDLIFVKDTDGDNVADVREVLLSGLSSDNTQHNFNGLTYGLDNWIYAANGGNAGEPYWPGKEDEATRLGWNDFRVDLDKQVFEKTGASSGGFELAIDNYGRVFGTHNTQHISHLVMPGHYAEGLEIGWGGTRTMISDHEEGGLGRIYPIGEQVTRVNHPEQSGFFSGACGITFYGGGAFPDGFNNNMFVCDVVLNLIHRDVIHEDGATFTASRGRGGVEFLASTDRAFRPVNMAAGPDGALYVLDMHRPVIEHPEWIPDEIEKDLDVNAGKDKGRIYRITPKEGLDRPKRYLGDVKGEELIAALNHPNQWWRITAQRLIVEHNRTDLAPHLVDMLSDAQESDGGLGKLHALWALEGLDALTGPLLVEAMGSADAGLRENAVIIAAERINKSSTLRKVVADLAEDDSPRVRMNAALALGRTGLEARETRRALLNIAERDADDRWLRLAVASAFRDAPMILIEPLLERKAWTESDGAVELLAMMCDVAGSKSDGAEVADIVQRFARYEGSSTKVARALNGLADGLAGQPGDAKKSIAKGIGEDVEALMGNGNPRVVEGVWRLADAAGLPPTPTQQALLDEAAEIAEDGDAPVDSRLDHLALLRFQPFEEREELLFAMLDTREPRELQQAAVEQLADQGSKEIAERLLSMWGRLGPGVRETVGNMLLRRPHLHLVLLAALEVGPITVGEMNFDLERRRALLWSGNEEVNKRAEALFSDAGVVTRKEALDKMRPALNLEGDPAKGHELFTELCSKCHKVGEEGSEIGPNLTEIARKSAETLLHDIVDPNAVVNTQYITYTVETEGENAFDSEIVNGLLLQDAADRITLYQADGTERVVARNDISEMRSTGLSLMPEELEAEMTPQDMANLLAFLQEAQ